MADLNQTAWEMRISKEYQKYVKYIMLCWAMLTPASAKCDYGSEECSADTATFGVRVPKLDRSYTNTQLGIGGGDMQFQRSVVMMLLVSQPC